MPRTAKPHQVAPDLDHAHDGGFAAASERAARAIEATPAEQIGRPLLVDPNDSREIRVGTASWTDPTITKGGVFYPRGVSSSEDRDFQCTTALLMMLETVPIAILCATET